MPSGTPFYRELFNQPILSGPFVRGVDPIRQAVTEQAAKASARYWDRQFLNEFPTLRRFRLTPDPAVWYDEAVLGQQAFHRGNPTEEKTMHYTVIENGGENGVRVLTQSVSLDQAFRAIDQFSQTVEDDGSVTSNMSDMKVTVWSHKEIDVVWPEGDVEWWIRFGPSS